MNRRMLISQPVSLSRVAATTARGVPVVDGNAARRAKQRIPNVPVRTHEGKSVFFYDDLIKGKCVLINFMYSNCDGICPGQTANLVEVQKALGDRLGRDVFIYSITLDPERDTPEALAAYAESYGTKPGWNFLTGAPEDLEVLRRTLGFVDADPEKDKIRSQHIGMVLIGNESLSRWSACPALSNASVLVELVGWMKDGSEGAPAGGERKSPRRAPTCPVDRNRGAIAVTFEGQTHYVCSPECKNAFEANPRGVLDRGADALSVSRSDAR